MLTWCCRTLLILHNTIRIQSNIHQNDSYMCLWSSTTLYSIILRFCQPHLYKQCNPSSSKELSMCTTTHDKDAIGTLLPSELPSTEPTLYSYSKCIFRLYALMHWGWADAFRCCSGTFWVPFNDEDEDLSRTLCHLHFHTTARSVTLISTLLYKA